MKGRYVSWLALLAFNPFAASAETADVIHWWTSGSEAKAIKVIADDFTAKGNVWKDSAVVGDSGARASATNRIMGGDPPTAMQWQLGVDLDNLAKLGVLASIDKAAEQGGWLPKLPPLVREEITNEGHIIAAPVTIHGENWMWYNTKVYTDLGLKPAATWDQFIADAEKIKAAGITPIALGGQPWQEQILFDSVLIGVAGHDAYVKLIVDKDSKFAEDPSVVKAFEIFKSLRKYVDAGSPGRNWNDATAMVSTGKAAVQFMGDWAKGEFASAGLTPGKEYGCDLPPGNQDTYKLVIDVFAFPKLGGEEEAAPVQAALVDSIMNPAVQKTFSINKGSLPIRSDVDVSDRDVCIQKAATVLRNPKAGVPNYGTALSGDLRGALLDVITRVWNDPTYDAKTAATAFAVALKQVQ